MDNVPTSSAFVEAVMTRLGVTGPSDFTRTMGWELNTPSLIAKWRGGLSAPSYEYVMGMLIKCDWLKEDAVAALEQAVDQLRDAVVDLESRLPDDPEPDEDPR